VTTWISTAEAAGLAGCSTQRVRKLCAEGKLTYRREFRDQSRHRNRATLWIDQAALVTWLGSDRRMRYSGMLKMGERKRVAAEDAK